ncbi:TetR/AcrR family transcriptional regulator [Sphingobium sp. TKS]|uniref:TetR/AcrR family transcriptional regulator n=1 Tax=Sphingobium sp. TKS TaxID=1315974 RepID=UPI0013141724|nr:TetR/AcrR family transcriptional regulator [Sphingobium sp. TKS]
MGRPRNKDVDRRILTAAIELFVRAGWQDFVIEEVARRARVGKASIYLRWSDREALLRDALLAFFTPWPVVPTGSFREELQALVRAVLSELSADIGWSISRVQSDPDIPAGIAQLCRGLIAERVAVVERLVESAKQRGEIPADAPTRLIMETVTGAALGHAGLARYSEPAPHGRDDPDDFARTLVDFLYPAFCRSSG